jgi:hypothetical protein
MQPKRTCNAVSGNVGKGEGRGATATGSVKHDFRFLLFIVDLVKVRQ